jgi:hypothetical protein
MTRTNQSYTKLKVFVEWTLGLFLLKVAHFHKKRLLRVRFEDVSNEEEADAILGNNLPIKCPNLAVTNSIFTK